MVKMLGMHYRGTVYIYGFIKAVFQRIYTAFNVCHLRGIIQIVLKELKALVIKAVLYCLN